MISTKKPPRRLRVRAVAGLTALVVGSAAALAGCTMFPEPTESTTSSTLRLTSPLIESLDPQTITNGFWILSRGILEGLVTQNSDATDVVPAVAESWDVSSDGTVYTFTLRDDATWSNGDPLTAEDFERTYQRLLSPREAGAGSNTAGTSAYQASLGVKGASDYLSGAQTDWSEVGVKATGERELEFTLAAPNADFLLGLTHPSMLPLNMDVVEANPETWQEPGVFVSNGPFSVEAFVPNSSMKLVANDEYWDRESVSLSEIDVLQVDAATAAGTLTVPFESGETDILPISAADVLRFQSDPELKDSLREVDTYMVAYLAKMRSENPVLDDVRIRQALSLALDREKLATVVPGARAGTSLVHDKVKGWDESLSIEEDIAEAKRLLAEAGYPDGVGLPPVHILSATESPYIDAVVDQWTTNLGIEAINDRVDPGVYVERRQAMQEGDYIGFYEGTFAGLPTLRNYVTALWNPTDVQNFSMPSAVWAEYLAIQADATLDPAEKNKQLSDLRAAHATEGAKEMAATAAQANAEVDEEKRNALFLEAAQLREDEGVYIPLLWSPMYFAVRPSVENLELRRYPDFFYLKNLSISE